MTLTFTTIGLPAPQGSKRHVGRGIMVESSRHLKPWRDSVTAAAREALLATDPPTRFPTGPVAVECEFVMPRPKAHYGSGARSHTLRAAAPARPDRRPDLDKLLRGVLDALTASGVIADDAQVVSLCAAKHYVGTLLDVPGAVVTVGPLRVGPSALDAEAVTA